MIIQLNNLGIYTNSNHRHVSVIRFSPLLAIWCLEFEKILLLQVWHVDNSANRSQNYIRRCENDIFFLPVNILMVWRAGFFGCTAHYCVS